MAEEQTSLAKYLISHSIFPTREVCGFIISLSLLPTKVPWIDVGSQVPIADKQTPSSANRKAPSTDL
jgi:hypothetical protein